METQFVDLWCWRGRVGRREYALAGITACTLKYLLDKLTAFLVFGRAWHLWSYWKPLDSSRRLVTTSSDERRFIVALLLLALPFIGFGVTLTVKRLRDAGLPLWLVGFFFVPVINLLFFLLLCTLESHPENSLREATPWPEARGLGRWIPRRAMSAALVSISVTMLFGLFLTILGTEVLRNYGWSLFVALPFCLGLFSVLLYSYHEPRSYKSCLGVSLLPILLIGALLILVMIEGVICILMAAPFAVGLAMLGGLLGYAIQTGYWFQKEGRAVLSMVLLFTPIFQGAEHWARLPVQTFEVRTSIDVDAPPQRVWDEMIAFAEIPPPEELLFRAGIAYPIRAEISGHGVGAERRCIFSTGSFVEPIEVWDQPRLLKFGVSTNPAPLNELTLYRNISPPHLHGYFLSK
jgi:uncharacterized membrane protein YhaH (DUF805 family)